ncbi:LptF/LptG family permease [Hydrogenimonas sp.]
MRMFRYISRLYLKHFVIIAFALAFFFAGLDYMQHAAKLSSFNIKVLYLFYKGSHALNLLFPIALVLSMIVSKMVLIRSNALVSFYALGYSRKAVLRPFFLISFLLTLFYVGIHFTSFVNAEISAKQLLEGKKSRSVTHNIFVKYNDSFIYISEIIPSRKLAKEIRIYRILPDRELEIIYGPSAVFDGKGWVVEQARVVRKPNARKLGGKGLVIVKKPRVRTLEGFKPKILTSVFEGVRAYAIQDAFEAMRLLEKEHLQSKKVKAVLYHMIVTPFFAVFLVVIFFLAIPPHARSTNLTWTSFALVGITLFVWGIFYLLYRISLSGVVMPEFGILVPVALLGLVAIHSYIFRTNR